MRRPKPTTLRLGMLAAVCSAGLCSGASAQGVAALPVPSECSSVKNLTLPRANYPATVKAYVKVDLYCGSSSKPAAKGATLCNSDYNSLRQDQKTVAIAVSASVKSGKAKACAAGSDLKIVAE
jgi:hypothetical protein